MTTTTLPTSEIERVLAALPAHAVIALHTDELLLDTDRSVLARIRHHTYGNHLALLDLLGDLARRVAEGDPGRGPLHLVLDAPLVDLLPEVDQVDEPVPTAAKATSTTRLALTSRRSSATARRSTCT